MADSPSPVSSEPPPGPHGPEDRDSGLTLSFAVTVSYQRQRGRINDRWEQRVDSIGLLIIGAFVVIIIIWIVLPRIMDAIVNR